MSPLSFRNPGAQQNLVAGALVAAVVLVIGFGSGIGSVISEHKTTSSTGTTYQQAMPPIGMAPGATAAAHPASGGLSAATTSHPAAPGLVTFPESSPTGSRSGGKTPSSGTPSSGTTSSGAPSPSSGTTSPSLGTTSAASCSNTMLVNAMLNPFIVHLDKAHLEESPGQQVTSLLNVDSYTQLHTVMVEDMVMPLITAIEVAFTGVDPLITHIDKAHLEETPGQQVSQLLNTDSYVQLHTVMVEDMLNPLTQSVTGTYGC